MRKRPDLRAVPIDEGEIPPHPLTAAAILMIAKALRQPETEALLLVVARRGLTAEMYVAPDIGPLLDGMLTMALNQRPQPESDEEAE